MPYDENKIPVPAMRHSISLEGRSALSVSGVEDVQGFDDSLVSLRTSMGELNIRGRELHIERIELESGELRLQGQIQELSYSDLPDRTSFWSRLFG